jgi:hypothetical protein
MLKKGNIPKNGAKEELPRIKPLTSRFPLIDLDLDFFAQRFQIKINKRCKEVYCAYAYQYILLTSIPLMYISRIFNSRLYSPIFQLSNTLN